MFQTAAAVLLSMTLVSKAPTFHNVKCEGSYTHHLQGICVDDSGSIFWSFTTNLVKTNAKGKVVKKIAVGNHHGDLCHQGGKIYVAVNFGRFNDPKGNADSWVYVYETKNLKLVSKHPVPKVVHGAGGIGYRQGCFYVVGGLPNKVPVNYVYEYDAKWRFVKRHIIKSGWTNLGIQTATHAHGRWYFGCYGSPQILLVTDSKFKMIGRHKYACSLGIVGVSKSQFLSASGKCTKKSGCRGSAAIAVADKKTGLRKSPAKGGGVDPDGKGKKAHAKTQSR